MAKMGKDAQLYHCWEKIPTEIISDLILAYSVLANRDIIKV